MSEIDFPTFEQRHGFHHRGQGGGHRGDERWMPDTPDAGLVELAAGLHPGTALDLGAGQGRNSLWLARQGWRVTAVDLSEPSLTRVSAIAREEGLSLTTVVADIHDYLAGATPVDLVVVAHIHPAASDRARLLAAAASAVAPGGHLFVVGHHVDSLGIAGPPDPDRLYTEERLASAFPGLRILSLARREHPTRPGSAPLVEVVAWATRPTSAADAPA